MGKESNTQLTEFIYTGSLVWVKERILVYFAKVIHHYACVVAGLYLLRRQIKTERRYCEK